MNRLLLMVWGIISLSGCIAPQSHVSTVYDFGATSSALNQPAVKLQSAKCSNFNACNIQVANVISPLWLDNQAIHYRFAYSNPTKLYTYANSHWVASPATLLTQQVRSLVLTNTPYYVIKDSAHARADYILQIELEEFIQVFNAADKSHVVVSLRASLIDRRSHVLLLQQRFSTQLPTPTADAEGAVTAFSMTSQKIANQVVDWIHLGLVDGS